LRGETLRAGVGLAFMGAGNLHDDPVGQVSILPSGIRSGGLTLYAGDTKRKGGHPWCLRQRVPAKRSFPLLSNPRTESMIACERRRGASRFSCWHSLFPRPEQGQVWLIGPPTPSTAADNSAMDGRRREGRHRTMLWVTAGARAVSSSCRARRAAWPWRCPITMAIGLAQVRQVRARKPHASPADIARRMHRDRHAMSLTPTVSSKSERRVQLPEPSAVGSARANRREAVSNFKR
jgi:hypothetical protein